MNNLTIKGSTEIFGVKVPKLYGGFGDNQKVMLAKTIAEIHGKETKHVNELINNNRSRFINNEHIIDIKGSKEFEVVMNDNGIMTQNAINRSTNIYILSERGYLRLLKIMDDDTAWQRFDVIEKDYFELKESIGQPKSLPQVEVDMIAAKYAFEILRPSEASRIRMLSTVCKNHNVNTNFLPSYTEEKPTRSATELLELYGSTMSARTFNGRLVKLGLLEEQQRNGRGGTVHKFKAITEAGLVYGKNVVPSQNERETQPHWYVHRFKELLRLAVGA